MSNEENFYGGASYGIDQDYGESFFGEQYRTKTRACID